MPTIFRFGSYRFYFYSHEPNEPPHVHVDWLKPISLARNLGFRPKELNKLQLLVEKHQKEFLEAWYGYFGIKSR
jgi:hypothetical protein